MCHMYTYNMHIHPHKYCATLTQKYLEHLVTESRRNALQWDSTFKISEQILESCGGIQEFFPQIFLYLEHFKKKTVPTRCNGKLFAVPPNWTQSFSKHEEHIFVKMNQN